MNKWGMLIDIHYCTGCHTCEVACEQERHLKVNQFGIKITETILDEGGEDGRVNIDYVPYVTNLCNFCLGRVAKGGKPSCVKHCLSQCITFGTAEEVLEAAKTAKKPIMFLK